MMRSLLIGGAAIVTIAACGQPPATGQTEQDLSAKAKVKLAKSSTTLVQTSDSAWTLTKTGAVDPSTRTVTWTITATEATTPGHHLQVGGRLRIENHGNLGATLGNAVVSLETRNPHRWTLASADVADATSGDAATTANIAGDGDADADDSFTENAASGALAFSDAQTGAPFSLVPEATIAPHGQLDLAFQATFDNDVLQLAPDTDVRVGVMLSFGNASGHGQCGDAIDINGNGTIDPDEAAVESLGSRVTLDVPPPVAATTTPSLSDGPADITATGTATFTNAQFALGATSGTASVTYDGGASGGTLTNCAHLTSPDSTIVVGGHTFTVPGLDLSACDTETIPMHCSPGAPGCGWSAGDLVTYEQGDWGGDPGSSTAAAVLASDYASVYAGTSGLFEAGIPGASGFSIQFDNPTSVLAYLPASGPPGALDADYPDPTSTPAGGFGGDVVALQLDLDFGSLTGGTSGLSFGALSVCNLSTLPALNGMTVAQVAALANTLLGGGTGVYTIDQIAGVVSSLAGAFENGTPSTFAQQSLIAGPCL